MFMWEILSRKGRKTFRMLPAAWAALLLLIASGAGAGSIVVFAATSVAVVSAGGKAVVTNTGGDTIRVRQDPGTDSVQIGEAHEGQTVDILAGPRSDKTGKMWFKVQAHGSTGWMAAEFLQGTNTPTATSTTVLLATAPKPKLTGSASVANTGGDPLRFRVQPSASARVLMLLSPGAVVAIQAGPVTDDTGIVWYGISANGSTGWAMAQYLVQAPQPSQAQATGMPEAKKTAVSQPRPSQEAQPTVPTAKPTDRPAATATQKPAIEPKPTATTTATQKPTLEPKPTATQKPPATPTAIIPTTQPTKSGPVSTMGQYRQWMEEARLLFPYQQSVSKMWSVMLCESGGNAGASGGGGRYFGLFQYAPATWAGSWNPYRNNSILDARSQIFATAKAWSIGMQGSWSCYYSTSG